jgi:hypothetical protein
MHAVAGDGVSSSRGFNVRSTFNLVALRFRTNRRSELMNSVSLFKNSTGALLICIADPSPTFSRYCQPQSLTQLCQFRVVAEVQSENRFRGTPVGSESVAKKEHSHRCHIIASWSNIASIPKLRDTTDSEGGDQLVGLVFYEKRKGQRQYKNDLESEEAKGLPMSLNAATKVANTGHGGRKGKKIIFKCRVITPIKFPK